MVEDEPPKNRTDSLLEKVLDSLTEREKKIFRDRFGPDRKTPADLEEVGRQFNITRKRIREIEAKQ